jgi:predicted phage terminase large subunit-like protein
MTRWHYDDLAGYLLDEMKHENWATLSLPAIAEDDNDIIGRSSGEALWPTDYSAERLMHIKKTIGSREWNAQYQQVPLPSEGGLINIDWFQKYDYTNIWLPVTMAQGDIGSYIKDKTPFRQFVISWDTAFKESQLNDPSACTVWGITKDRKYYLLEIFNKAIAYPKLKRMAIKIWKKYNDFGLGPVPVLIEDKASGQSLIQDLKNETTMPVIAIGADSNKQIRMQKASPVIEAGRVYLPDYQLGWVVDYESQLARFPLWRHDDLVDSTSQFIIWISKPKYKRTSSKRFWK